MLVDLGFVMAVNTMTSYSSRAYVVMIIIQLFCIAVSSMSASSNSLFSLEGLRKGQAHKAIPDLKSYLSKFGYLNYRNESRLKEDHYDVELESAVKLFQKKFRLEVTGMLDSGTIKLMTTPRCGAPDILVSPVSPQYSFFPGNPKWPASKYVLKYYVSKYGKYNGLNFNDVRTAVKSAFYEWSDNSKFTFTELTYPDWISIDLFLSFQSRDHGDCCPFDGPGNVLAHAWAPTRGLLHFDADENWSTADAIASDQVDLMTIALHEIGHLLGLKHSDDPLAIMYPFVNFGETKRSLGDDDMEGIQKLYNS